MGKRINNIICFIVSLMVVSCSLDTEPTATYTEDTFWYGAENAKAGLTGCYLPMRNGSFMGGFVVGLEESASPNSYNYDNRSGWNYIALGQQTTETGIFNGRWNDAYIGIGRCNMLLSKIDVNKELSLAEITQMKAQARFLRALYYSFLTTYYHSAPLITEAPHMSQSNLPRTDRATIIQFIIDELDAVSEILPKNYFSSGDQGRPTAGAALALKARVLLFEASPLCNPSGDVSLWRAAADAAYAVIDLKKYNLYPDYRKLFLEEAENKEESIFDIQAVKSPTGLGHSMDILLRQYNGAAPLKGMIDAYWTKDGEERTDPVYGTFVNDKWVTNPDSYKNLDPRFYHTIVYPGSTFMGETVKDDPSNIAFRLTQTGYTYKKYTIYDAAAVTDQTDRNLGESSSPINIMVLRYADILLMYAEAKNELGELTSDIWDVTIGAIRKRAGFTSASMLSYPGSDKAALTKHIRYERRIEFAGEGMYYNDLRRWKLAETEMNNLEIRKMTGERIATRYFNKNRDYWWPVSATQLVMNPALRPNNEGWE